MACFVDDRCARTRMGALCACGPLGIAGVDEDAALQVLAGMLLGRAQRVGDQLRISLGSGPSVELNAMPETDWLAWEALCAAFEDRCVRPHAGGCRRLLSFRLGSGPLPEICASAPRCGWTRRWLRSEQTLASFSAAATPKVPPAGW